jgi:hypothetical protein
LQKYELVRWHQQVFCSWWNDEWWWMMLVIDISCALITFDSTLSIANIDIYVWFSCTVLCCIPKDGGGIMGY